MAAPNDPRQLDPLGVYREPPQIQSTAHIPTNSPHNSCTPKVLKRPPQMQTSAQIPHIWTPSAYEGAPNAHDSPYLRQLEPQLVVPLEAKQPDCV